MMSDSAFRSDEVLGTDQAGEPDFRTLVGREGWNRLDTDIQRRFAPGHASTAIHYRGRMDIERSALGLVFATLAQLIGAPLPMGRAGNVPTIVRVSDDRDGGVVWERRLFLNRDRPPACIRSTKRLGPSDGNLADTLLECVDGGLGMVLAVFEEGRSLVFESRSYFLELAGMRVPIPALLTPGRCRVTHAAVAPTRFRFTMEMVHPLWGRTFHQTGLFNDPETAP